MYELSPSQCGLIAPLFDQVGDTLVRSCLDGSMGRAWADDVTNPQSARIVTAEFCFFGGRPNRALAQSLLEGYRFPSLLICDPPEGWPALLREEYGSSLSSFTRYRFEKTAAFDRERLRSFVQALPAEYELRFFDTELYHQAMSQGWSRSFCEQFEGVEDYLKRGLGVAVLRNGELVAGASSYTVYRGGIEIEIDTREDCRRKGLARACAASLILACLDRGLFPSWDAANLQSVALAKQLGYRFSREYLTYLLSR